MVPVEGDARRGEMAPLSGDVGLLGFVELPCELVPDVVRERG